MKRSTILPPLFFLILSGILIFCWFRFGHVYGGGDTGLPTYNPSVMVNIAGNIWWDSLAPGIPVAQGLTSVPILYFLSMPQMLGASPVFIQAFLFFILLFLMGYGMYLLALDIFGKSNRILAFSAGIFYLFNPYMMVQIWHRFIHNSMFFAAFLPFLILTWRAWIKKRNPVYLLLFLLVNFLAVYIFGTIAFIVAVWALLFLLTLLEAIIPWKGRKTAFSLLVAFLIGLIFWFLTNSWWLMPTFSVSPAILAEVHTTDDSLNTLLSLSNSTILPYTLRLINPFYLYWEADFGTGYRNIFFQVISWLFVPIVFIGFIRGLKQKQYIIWSLLFLIIIFLSKGAAPPFNFPYIWGFSHFFPLGVIRNPFEKLGILLPFIFAILFSSGLQFLLASGFKAIGRFKTIAVLIILILLQMTFFWPMFAGKLFGTFEKQNFVDVPSSYAQADRWIKEDLDNSKEGRILHLPLSNKEDIIYNWQYGYHGVEPSAAIFTSLPSIARGLDLPRVNDALSGLSLIFHKPNATDPAVILKMLQDFNVKYVILHKDVDWLASSLYNPAETEAVLDNLSFLERKIAFGNLIIYKLSTSSFSRKIILSDSINFLYSFGNNLFWPWVIATQSSSLVTNTNQEKSIITIKNSGRLIFPKMTLAGNEASPGGLKAVFRSPEQLKYEILMPDAKASDFYSNKLSLLDFSINGEKKSLTGKRTGNLLSFGEIDLNSGLNEIDYGLVFSENLLSDFKKWNKTKDVKIINQSDFQMSLGNTGFSYIDGDMIEGMYSGGIFNVSFDISTNSDVVVFVQLVQDTDPDEKNDHNRLIGAGVRDIPSSRYFSVNTMSNWQRVSFAIPQLRPITQKVRFRLITITPYQSEWIPISSNILVRNLTINRILNNPLILRSTNNASDFPGPVGEIFFDMEEDPFSFQGKIKLDKPALLIFKETYHTDWKLELTEGNNTSFISNHFLANGFSNAWFIEKPGNYKFKIIFEPQNYVVKGVIIAVSSLVGIILFAVYNVLKVNRNK